MPKKNQSTKSFPSLPRLAIFIILFALIFLEAFYFFRKLESANTSITELNLKLSEIEQKQSDFSENFAEQLFVDHLKMMEIQKSEAQIAELSNEIEKLKTEETTNKQVSEIYTNYDNLLKKSQRNTSVNLKVDSIDNKVNSWGELLLKKDYEPINSEISDLIKNLDEEYNKYVASLPKPTASGGGQGYSYTKVETEKGTFGVHLIKLPMSSYQVKTVAANSDDCKDNCPTKSLGDYIKDNNAYAGINGSYFCPPDYANCSGKTNSYDYAFYNSNKGKWLNKGALSWFKTGLITFSGSSGKFYEKSSDYGGGGVSAGISNYPSLVKEGNIVVKSEELTSYQKDTKGNRGAIGIGTDNVYLAIINRATVIDAAYVMRALGAKDALNIDGGGSSAMYINNGYVVGPGRSLPNAVVLVKK